MSPDEVLEFWFGAHGSAEYGQPRAMWFKKDPAFDALLRERFGDLHARAAAGELSDWVAADASCLALIVVLDQFSRNLYRGQPASFACDAEALRLAKLMVEQGRDTRLTPVMRSFCYLPFEHSENLRDQDEAVRLFGLLASEPALSDLLVWAEKHRDVVRRFGRFPHRNAILGRPSTAQELAFLEQPGSSF